MRIDDETFDAESNGCDDDGNEEEKNSSEIQETTEIKETEKNKNVQPPSFRDALRLLCNKQYNFDCHISELCKVYAIVIAVPVSPAISERSFSALKRVKARIRSSMVQDRLEGLLYMAVER